MSFTEGELEAFCEFAPIGMARVGIDGAFLEVNPAYEKITGYSSHELKRLRWQDITPPGDREDDQAMVQEILNGSRKSYEIRKSYNQKDNGIIPVLLTVRGVYDGKSDQISHFLVTATERPYKIMMSHGDRTVAGDSSEEVKSLLFTNWKWILTATIASITTLSAWLANIETTGNRVQRNQERIESLEGKVDEVLEILRQ